jgi:mono/diheme cytochrome c family protein
MKRTFVLLGLGVALWGLACRTVPQKTVGEIPEGDAAKGKEVFVSLQCYTCHQVIGHDFPPPKALPQVPVILGAEAKPPTRAELIDSILNPSHSLAPGFAEDLIRTGQLSRMGDYGDALNVKQLGDLVAFLRSLHQKRTNYE